MRHGKARFVTGFLALPVALYVYYVLWPFAQAAGYSLTDWGGYSDQQHFVGFSNYVRLFHDELFRKAFWHSVFFLVTLPLLTIVLALFLACSAPAYTRSYFSSRWCCPSWSSRSCGAPSTGGTTRACSTGC